MRRNVLSASAVAFFKKCYYFRCISNGKYTYLTAEKILERPIVALYEPLWLHGNDRYLEELSTSKDFDPTINYVIITQEDLITTKYEENSWNDTFLSRLFKTEELLPLSKLIEFETRDYLDGLLPEGWQLVKFTNYRSDNIIEDFHDNRLLNSEHPFMKLLIDNIDFFNNDDNRALLDIFLLSFRSFRMNYDFSKLIEYQEKIVDKLKRKGKISDPVVASSKITSASLPQAKNYNEDFV